MTSDSSPTPADAVKRGRWLSLAAVVLFLACSLPLTVLSSGDRSGWNAGSAPVTTTGGGCGNPVTAYCALQGDTLFFYENRAFVFQTLAFCGDEQHTRHLDVYAKRGGYAFLASLLAPAVGVVNALLIINWLAWALCAWISWRWAVEQFHDRVAGLLAVLFTVGGVGMIVHVGDYSAHLLAIASYYLGAYLLFRSGVWREPQNWRTHLMLGAYFGLAGLCYNTGLMLTAAYAVVSWRHARWPRVALGVALAVAGPIAWVAILRQLNPAFSDLEVHYLIKALEAWRSLAQQPAQFAAYVATTFLDFALFGCPLVVIAGLAALGVGCARRGAGRLTALLLLTPVAAGMIFSTTATARGYLVYGASVLVYVSLARLLSLGLRRPGLWRVLTVGGAVVLLAAQFSWSTAHFFGRFGPAQSYVYGVTTGYPSVAQGRCDVLSLTDQEPTPTFWGGAATMTQAGAFTRDAWREPTERSFASSFRLSLTMRSAFAVYAALLAAAAGRRRVRGVLLGVLVLAAVGAHSAWSARAELRSPQFTAAQGGLPIPPGSVLNYEVELGERFVEALQAEYEADDRICLFAPRVAHAQDVRFTLDGADLALTSDDYGYWSGLNEAEFLDRLSTSRRLGFSAAAGDEPARFVAWQRDGLPGRQATIIGGKPSPARLPALEIRLIDRRGAIKLIGF